MKNTLYTILSLAFVAVFSVTVLSSCDKDANKPEYQWGIAGYVDSTNVALYTPDTEVERDSLSQDGMLTSTIVVDTVFMVASNKDGMGLYINGANDVTFALPFLDANGEVRAIFKDGVFAQLFNRLKGAADAGLIERSKYDAFKKEIAVIRDTISLGAFGTDAFTYDEIGAALMSWDFVQNSNYVRIKLDETPYSRRSNIYTAMLTIKPELEAIIGGMPDSKEKEELVNQLQAIWQAHSGILKDGSGWLTLCYVNYRLNFEMHLEKGSGLLDDMAKGLYGVNAYGEPLKELWLIVNFDGTINPGTGYERL